MKLEKASHKKNSTFTNYISNTLAGNPRMVSWWPKMDLAIDGGSHDEFDF